METVDRLFDVNFFLSSYVIFLSEFIALKGLLPSNLVRMLACFGHFVLITSIWYAHCKSDGAIVTCQARRSIWTNHLNIDVLDFING